MFYDAASDRAGGGAERQTWLLAHDLARRGLRVAHVVYPVVEPRLDPSAPVTLVQRPVPGASGALRALPGEVVHVCQALNRADAAVQVFRGASGAVGIAGAWARARRRSVVFAGANNADFTLETFGGPADPRARMFRAGMRLADAVVVQSGDQVALARRGFPHVAEIDQVPSFVELAPPADGPGEAFLWISRLTDYKRPLLYANLAEAVPEARFWMVASRSDAPEYGDLLAELQRRAGELPNLELLDQRPHAELQALIGRAVAMVNTSSFEGVPNTWLEGWARGVPALTLSFDPDERIARHGLGLAAGGSVEDFAAAARRLWARRADRGGYSETVRAHVADVHGRRVGDRWAEIVQRLGATRRRRCGRRPR